MARGSAKLATNNTGAADTTPVYWTGGRCVLVLIATTYPSTCKLQTLGQDTTTWIDINASAYTANQVTAYDLPPGQYRMHLSGGTAAALYADLIAIPYT